jgi:hypothetical protein
LINLRGTRLISYPERFVSPLAFAQQYLGNVKTNVRTFLARDFHTKSGMKYLIETFISYREILLTPKIMDDIVEQLSVPDENSTGRSSVRPGVRLATTSNKHFFLRNAPQWNEQ